MTPCERIHLPHHKETANALFVLFLYLFLCPQTGLAAASVNFAEITRLSWGTLAIPSSGSVYVDVHANNTSPSGTGSVLFGAPGRGQYNLTLSEPDTSTSMTLDIHSVVPGSPNLTLGSFEAIYGSTLITSFPATGLPLPDSGTGTPLYIGARATVTSAQIPATINPTFNIDITLQ